MWILGFYRDFFTDFTIRSENIVRSNASVSDLIINIIWTPTISLTCSLLSRVCTVRM